MPLPRTHPRPWSALHDWAPSPLAASVAPALARLLDLDHFPSVAALDARLGDLLPTRADGARYALREDRAVRPRRAPPRPVDAVYDVVIDARGEIPTRPNNWHDLFNALVWASFPRAKARLSARQRRLHEARRDALSRAPAARTRAQDAMAMLDEGAALVLCAPDDLDALSQTLLARAPDALWTLQRDGRLRVLLFGHALLEHLVHGDDARAAVIPLAVGGFRDALDLVRARADLVLATRLDDPDDFTAPGPFAAVPVNQVAATSSVPSG